MPDRNDIANTIAALSKILKPLSKNEIRRARTHFSLFIADESKISSRGEACRGYTRNSRDKSQPTLPRSRYTATGRDTTALVHAVQSTFPVFARWRNGTDQPISYVNRIDLGRIGPFPRSLVRPCVCTRHECMSPREEKARPPGSQLRVFVRATYVRRRERKKKKKDRFSLSTVVELPVCRIDVPAKRANEGASTSALARSREWEIRRYKTDLVDWYQPVQRPDAATALVARVRERRITVLGVRYS